MTPRITEEFSFAEPAWFFLLLALPVIAWLLGAAGRQSSLQFSSLHLLRDLGRRTKSAPFLLTALFSLLTLAAGITALARPQHVRTEEKAEESGVEIFLTLDLSLSMSIEDMRQGDQKVNRLVVAKRVARDFIRKRTSDRIGLVIFSGRPYLASPLTLDQAWLLETLDKIYFHQTDEMGTAIGSAIATAANRLTSREAKGKTIILVTDGANNSGEMAPLEAAKAAATLGVKIYTVAIGTYGHHVVPELRRITTSNLVRQEFDEETLKSVAKISGGRFYHARDSGAMEDIFREIDNLEKTRLSIHRTTHVDELYHWPLWTAVACGILALLGSTLLFRRYP